MWEQLGGLGQTALAIIALAAMAGFGLQRGHTKNLESRLTEERTQVDRLTTRVNELESSDVKKTTEIANLRSLKTNEAVLSNVADELTAIDGRLSKFGERLEDHNTAATTHWEKQREQLADLIEATRSKRDDPA